MLTLENRRREYEVFCISEKSKAIKYLVGFDEKITLQDAEDLFQDVTMKVMKHYLAGEIEGEYEYYFWRAIKNSALTFVKNADRELERVIYIEQENSLSIEKLLNVDEEIEQIYCNAKLAGILNESQLEVVKLKVYGNDGKGMPHEMVGKKVGKSTDAVKKIYNRAMKILQKTWITTN